MKERDPRSVRPATGLTSSHGTGGGMFEATRALHKKTSDVAGSQFQHDTATYVSGATPAVEYRAYLWYWMGLRLETRATRLNTMHEANISDCVYKGWKTPMDSSIVLPCGVLGSVR